MIDDSIYLIRIVYITLGVGRFWPLILGVEALHIIHLPA